MGVWGKAEVMVKGRRVRKEQLFNSNKVTTQESVARRRRYNNRCLEMGVWRKVEVMFMGREKRRVRR